MSDLPIDPAASYRTALVREVTGALKKTFTSSYPDPLLREIFIGPEFQEERTKYPMILITFSQSMVKRMGIGHYLILDSDDVEDAGETKIVQQWFFQGAISFNCMALNSFERDVLTDTMMGVVGFGKPIPGSIANTYGSTFHREIEDNDFLILYFMHDNILPGSETTFPTPWNADETVYHSNYSVPITGEFFSDPRTRSITRISRIRQYPYRPDQPVPTGSTIPADKEVPWI